MKYAVWTVIVIACFVLGLFAYGPLQSSLLGNAAGKSVAAENLLRDVTVHGPGGRVTVKVDFGAIPPEELPETVILKERIDVSAEGQASVTLQAGSKVRVRRIENGLVVVSPGSGPMEGEVAISATDLGERIAESRLQKTQDTAVAKVDPAPAPKPAPAPAPTVTPVPKPRPVPPDAVAINDPPTPDPTPKPESRPEPQPKPPSPKDDVFARQAEALYPMPDIKPLMEIVHNWADVPRSAYPDRVMIKVPLDFEVLSDGAVAGGGTLPAGTSVIPLELVGDTLTITNGSDGFAGAPLNVNETDFKEQVRERYEKFIVDRTRLIHARRAAERDRLAKAAALEASLQAYNEGTDPRFDALRESLRQGDAGFYQLDAASKWRWAEKETIGGVEYEVGFVMMASESAFGVMERELKALIRDGKVEKWIDVASGQEF